jgi:murein DD-endopeptidase MepM/ murein hydrolase activator NlpD
MWGLAPLGRRGRTAALGLVLLLAAACTEYQPIRPRAEGAYGGRAGSYAANGARRHLVMPGETLSELALRYRVPMSQLAKANRIRRPYPIYVGQVLAVPSVIARPSKATAPTRQLARMHAKPAARPAVTPAEVVVAAVAAPEPLPAQDEATREATRKAAETEPPPLTGDGFIWPVSGQVVDGFGDKPNGARNDGINIAARDGTPVLAAENGVVVYAGSSIPGFGRMLLVRHADGFMTAYAHNSALEVGVGDEVLRGQPIAQVGSTGDVASPQLHFELRLGAKPVDPSRHLVDGDTEIASSNPTS